MEETIRDLDGLMSAGRYAELEDRSRALLAGQRFFMWHQYLIVALLRTGRREAAARELDELFTYKFNIEDRAWPEVKDAFPEKFSEHFILSAMRAEIGFESGTGVRRRWDVVAPVASPGAFAMEVDKMLAQALPALPALPRTARVATFGSCFAAHLARILRESRVDATNLLIEESINSPLANQAFLSALADPEGSGRLSRIEATFGAGFARRAKERLASAQVILLTLGVAPSLFHADSGEFVFLEDYNTLLAEGAVYMRTPSVSEAKTVVAEVLALVHRISPRARLYVSVSPVPLVGTLEFSNAVLADTVSKTTLRAALHEVLQSPQAAGAHYWPSFEIVRWLGAHTTLPVFGQDDNASRHVSEWVVRLIVDRFARHLFAHPAEAA